MGLGISFVFFSPEILLINICKYYIVQLNLYDIYISTSFILLDHVSLFSAGLNGEDYKFELGANWVHGVTNNPVHALAVKHDLYSQLTDQKLDWRRYRCDLSLYTSQ